MFEHMPRTYTRQRPRPRPRPLLDLSPTQLLQLWTQLLTAYAYYSDNRFGGHAQTAAIRRDWAAARRRLNEAVDRRR